MKKIIYVLLGVVFIIGCKSSFEETKAKVIKKEDYELIKAQNEKGVLILFPGAGGNATTIKNEFAIIDKAVKRGVSVLMMNFSRRLWIEKEDCRKLASDIMAIIEVHKLESDNVFIGGMSIGGNIALTLSQYLLVTQELPLQGSFIIDSPIDLYGLYESSLKDVERKDLSEERLSEPRWIISFFEESFHKDSVLQNIQKVAPYTSKTRNIKNMSQLKTIKTRFYIEPDLDWYKNVRKVDFKDTNAHTIQELYYRLQREGWMNVALIETSEKGYRSNGDRNPHSWSIVEVDDLLNWMLE
ncbi:Abhydrolase_3 domain-containing protein [Tenacibaculum sp. 190130A14a]|uniref:Abhydrolase_3 domain-containing protein n=1 Tax=Tenacibaculum polynesiense TaxID=3137857 RepID=A0ABP1F1H8_9FLAO